MGPVPELACRSCRGPDPGWRVTSRPSPGAPTVCAPSALTCAGGSPPPPPPLTPAPQRQCNTPHPQTGVPLSGPSAAAERRGGARSGAKTSAPAISLLAGRLQVCLSHLHTSPQHRHASSHQFTAPTPPPKQPRFGSCTDMRASSSGKRRAKSLSMMSSLMYMLHGSWLLSPDPIPSWYILCLALINWYRAP